MATYKLISSVTVGAGGAANIEFTGIPATYTDLVLKCSARYSGAGANTMRLSFNNNSSNYAYRYLEGSGTSVVAGITTSLSYLYGGYVPGTSNTASAFSNNEMYISNYASSNNKFLSTDYVLANNSTSAVYSIMLGQSWANSSAITSIKLIPETNDFVQYTTAYLYGISNA